MDLNRFLLDRMIAEREGVTDDAAANRVALMGSLIAPSNMLLALLMVQLLARKEVAAQAPAPPPPAPGPPAVPWVAPLMTYAEAAGRITELGFNPTRPHSWEDIAEIEVVVAQSPAPHARVPPSTDVTLYVAKLKNMINDDD